MADKRFSRVANDPRFKKIPRKHRKVKIDSRFQLMFTDKKFTTKYFVDKRGAALGKTTKEDLHQFYDLSDEDKDENPMIEEEQNKAVDCNTKRKAVRIESKSESNNDEAKTSKRKKLKEKAASKPLKDKDSTDSCDTDDSDQNDEQDTDNNNTVDLARGEGNIESSSDDESDDDDSDQIVQKEQQKITVQTLAVDADQDSDDESDLSDEDNKVEHQWAELDNNVKKTSNTSKRFAVCNLDWDRINANDLFVLFSSLKMKGVVKSVKIYPSEFGLKRLQNEECYGPEEIVKQPSTEDNNSNVEGAEFSREKLRQYQINRLKYYYAVVDCDSAKTANDIYNEYDGVEFELSGNMLDLRFIPDDMEFEHEPTSVATQLPSQALYEPPQFETTALHQTNVKLTWDETDIQRLKTTMRAFNKDELQNMDFEAYLASSSDDDDDGGGKDYGDDIHDLDSGSGQENEEDSIAKYKKLVQEIDAKEHQDDNDNEMEITWEPGLKESALDLVAKKKAEKYEKNSTPWETYLNKKNEKRKEKRAKERKEKGNKDESDEDEEDTPEGVDMSDPFFNQDFGPDFPANNPQNKTKKSTKHVKETEEDKKQKEELELLLMDENDERQHFSLKNIMENEKKKKKRKKKRKEQPNKEDSFSVNVEDPRFSALFSSHLYAIDPSDPQFKDTKAMNTILEERQRRRSKPTKKSEKKDMAASPRDTGKKTIKDPSLSMLVNSVKSKAGEFHQRKKKRKHVD